MKYTTEQKINIIKWYARADSAQEVVEQFKEAYPEEQVPTIKTIYDIWHKFEKSGCLNRCFKCSSADLVPRPIPNKRAELEANVCAFVESFNKSGRKSGRVCAAPNCMNKKYKKNFFLFPKVINRARAWAVAANRNDILENLSTTRYELCADHFELKMFTNHLCNRLKYNAVPTLFPEVEGSSKDNVDSKYSQSKLEIEVPHKKICIRQNTEIAADKLTMDKMENLETYVDKPEFYPTVKIEIPDSEESDMQQAVKMEIKLEKEEEIGQDHLDMFVVKNEDEPSLIKTKKESESEHDNEEIKTANYHVNRTPKKQRFILRAKEGTDHSEA